ncbi:unnamed protein product [Calicophoron daubneyi]|uniref:Secreted protein n=1 Tax=Calicophoron daubneyi TaxID=300641 RepID=A0AAV2TTK6_CALDB
MRLFWIIIWTSCWLDTPITFYASGLLDGLPMQMWHDMDQCIGNLVYTTCTQCAKTKIICPEYVQYGVDLFRCELAKAELRVICGEPPFY